MNAVLAEYFDSIEAQLITSPAITSYQILRREIAVSDGKLRVKASLGDGGTIELFEYVREENNRITIQKYSFHWQDAQEKLVRRWDNAPHHKELGTSFHAHQADGTIKGSSNAINMLQAIEEIEKYLSQ